MLVGIYSRVVVGSDGTVAVTEAPNDCQHGVSDMLATASSCSLSLPSGLREQMSLYFVML
jgi:hypothetical protein